LDHTKDKHNAINTSHNRSKIAVTSVEKKKGIISPKVMSTASLKSTIGPTKKVLSKSPENNLPNKISSDFKKNNNILNDGSLATKTIDININRLNLNGLNKKAMDRKESPRIVSGGKTPALKIKGFYEIAKTTAINSGSKSARIMYKSKNDSISNAKTFKK
jgi:hypothetical protein